MQNKAEILLSERGPLPTLTGVPSRYLYFTIHRLDPIKPSVDIIDTIFQWERATTLDLTGFSGDMVTVLQDRIDEFSKQKYLKVLEFSHDRNTYDKINVNTFIEHFPSLNRIELYAKDKLYKDQIKQFLANNSVPKNWGIRSYDNGSFRIVKATPPHE